MYGKIENNRFMQAPNPIIKDDKKIYNPTADMLIEQGYKPVVSTSYPQDGKHYKKGYEENAEEIRIVWVDNEGEYWQNIPYDDAVNAEIRKQYSDSQEFAILRQEKEKPEEYEAYFSYCEECKAFVKQKKAQYA